MKPWEYITAGVVVTVLGGVVVALASSAALDGNGAGPMVLALVGALATFLGILLSLVGVIGQGVLVGNRTWEGE